jgi:hypothetical protein
MDEVQTYKIRRHNDRQHFNPGAGGYLSLHDEKTYPSYLFIEAQGMKMYMILGLCRLANKRSI